MVSSPSLSTLDLEIGEVEDWTSSAPSALILCMTLSNNNIFSEEKLSGAIRNRKKREEGQAT